MKRRTGWKWKKSSFLYPCPSNTSVLLHAGLQDWHVALRKNSLSIVQWGSRSVHLRCVPQAATAKGERKLLKGYISSPSLYLLVEEICWCHFDPSFRKNLLLWQIQVWNALSFPMVQLSVCPNALPCLQVALKPFHLFSPSFLVPVYVLLNSLYLTRWSQNFI